jgi:beta-lactam-binding protein with PASTA domain
MNPELSGQAAPPSPRLSAQGPALGPAFYLKLLALAAALGALTAFLSMRLAIKGGVVTMPNLVGGPRLASMSQLRQIGLSLKVDDQRFSSAQNHDTILSQDIPAGSRIKRGRTVHVVLSLGPAQVVAPDLTGMTERQALILLQQNGLQAGVLDHLYSAEPLGAVLAQDPDPGSTLVHEAAVSLLVSDGPEPVLYAMPDLAGRTLDSVRAALSQMGLIVRGITELSGTSAPQGTVVAQSLPPDAPVGPGQDLTLSVAKGQGQGSQARFTTLNYQVPSKGVSEKRVRINVVDESGTRVAYQEMEKPGASLAIPFTVHGKARCQVYLSGQMVQDAEIP